MNSSLNKLQFWLKRHVWFCLAFFVPLALRFIPEILSWPYPLGLDTLRYIPFLESGAVLSTPLKIFQNQLFYPLTSFIYKALPDGILIIKVLGPLLLGILCLMAFLYAKRGLGWGESKSFLVALLIGTYFVSLRNSWDLFSQTLGLILLLATFVILKAWSSSRRYLFALIFVFLTVWSHELVSVILIFVLGLEAISLLFAKKIKWDFVYSVAVCGFALLIFFLRHFSPVIGGVVIPSADVTSASSFAFALLIAELLLYCYLLLLPFAAIGVVTLKDAFLKYWTIWCLLAILLLAVIPNLPIYYWNRWVYLLVYPLLFFAVEGLDRLWHLWSKHKSKTRHLFPKVVAILYIVSVLSLSGFYSAANPENQIPFFSTANPCLSFIPSSMLQNTLPISDNPSFIACLDWINNNSVNGSTIVIHYALYDLAKIYIHGRPITPVNPNVSMEEHLQNETSIIDSIVAVSAKALNSSNSTVYTIWWVNGDGWYKISSLPPVFKEVFRSDRMAVYVFDQT